MKHSQKLVDQAHDLAFRGDLSNKQIAYIMELTDNQLAYILYQRRATDVDPTTIQRVLEEPTITESFLNFFISEDFK